MSWGLQTQRDRLESGPPPALPSGLRQGRKLRRDEGQQGYGHESVEFQGRVDTEGGEGARCFGIRCGFIVITYDNVKRCIIDVLIDRYFSVVVTIY
jgi:hypothetical protein